MGTMFAIASVDIKPLKAELNCILFDAKHYSKMIRACLSDEDASKAKENIVAHGNNIFHELVESITVQITYRKY